MIAQESHNGATGPLPCGVCSGRSFRTLFEKEGHTFVRCEACSLERIDPPPTDETLSKIYGDHYYDAWGLRRDADRVAKLKKGTFGDLLAKLPRPTPGAKLLDCGAATGFLLEVARDMGWDPYAIEFGDLGANELRRKFGDTHVFQGEIEKARFDDAGEGAFQVVTMCDYIEHVRDPARVLSLAHALLAARGHLVITTPDAGSLSHAALRSGWTHYKVEHLHYFRKDNMARLLERCGFSDVEFHPLAKSLSIDYIREMFDAYPHPILSRAARLAGHVVPDSLRSQRLRLRTGEMFAVATRA